MKILFITSTRIGDAVISSGLLSHLIERHPDARITIACGPAAAPLFAAVPGVERIVTMKKTRWHGHWLRLWRASVVEWWHLVVDLRSSALSYLVPARRRLVYRRDNRPIHRVESLGALVGAAEPPAPRVWLAPAHEAAAARLVPAGRPLLVLGPGAEWRGKRWHKERFAALAARLTAPGGLMPGAGIAVLGSAAEHAYTRSLVASLPDCIDLVGAVDLLTAAALLRRCDLFIGNDTGLVHVAGAAGAPTLALFGPTREVHYAPWGPRTAVVRTAASYDALVGAPGYDPRTTGTLMETLTVEMAEEGARAFLGAMPGKAATA